MHEPRPIDVDATPPYSRRALLKHGLVLASASLTLPAFLERSALAMAQTTARAGTTLGNTPGVDEDRVLVVVQLAGGNDGLNTVVPCFAPEYYKARPAIAIAQRDALMLDAGAGIGLHPALAGLKGLFDDGHLAVVQGVGYPNPNRSHFKSNDIWQTADVTATGNGWLGRFLDSQCCGFGKGESGTAPAGAPTVAQGPGAVVIGRTAPLALDGSRAKPVVFEDASLFQWSARELDKTIGEEYDGIQRREQPQQPTRARETNADFLVRTALDAQLSSDQIRKAVANLPAGFPANELGRQLSMVAAMLRAGLRSRVYYVSYGGFDTHAGQGGTQGRHAQLLRALGDALRAFYAELDKQGNSQRVLTMTFSEFGRRVGQNASGGTDHGTAAPMFLAGPMVRSGLINQHPNMRDLDDGDVKFSLDFRSVYAGILTDWLRGDPTKVLDGSFRAAKVVRG